MPSRKLTIEYLPVASLRLDPKNARLHSDGQIRQIAKSIEAFGFNVPVLVDANSQVVAGHGRLLACKLLGIAHVPAILLEHLSGAQRRAFMIADNRLTENSEWDNRLLAEQLMTLSQAELDFSVEVTGFEMGEIDVMIENLAPVGRCKDDPADAIPDSRTKPHVTRAGDLWALDRHRVYCGDARSEVSYSALMKGCRAQMVFADPGYDDPIGGYVTRPGKIHHHPEFISASGEMSPSEFTTFLMNIFAQIVRNTVEGTFHFICMDWRRSGEVISAARSVYSEFESLCVWVKDGAGRGSLYKSQHELIFVFKSGTKSRRNNVQLGKHRRYRTNVWQYPRVNSDLASSSIPRPTIKPVELVADAILDCSVRGSVVLDPFLGAGTSVIASERTGRACFGIELNPVHVDATIRRWQSLTRQQAVNALSGRTFNEIEQEITNG